jgi:hypothetical protein
MCTREDRFPESNLKSADAPTKQVERSVLNGKTDKRQIR